MPGCAAEEGRPLTWGDLEAAAGYSPRGPCHDPYDIQVYCAYFALPRVFEQFGDEVGLVCLKLEAL